MECDAAARRIVSLEVPGIRRDAKRKQKPCRPLGSELLDGSSPLPERYEESTAQALNSNLAQLHCTICACRLDLRETRFLSLSSLLVIMRGEATSPSALKAESIANSQGLFSIAIEDEAALLHHSNRSRERREGVGDDAGDSGAGVKVVDECACTFGGVPFALEARKDAIADLARSGRVVFGEGAEATDERA